MSNAIILLQAKAIPKEYKEIELVNVVQFDDDTSVKKKAKLREIHSFEHISRSGKKRVSELSPTPPSRLCSNISKVFGNSNEKTKESSTTTWKQAQTIANADSKAKIHLDPHPTSVLAETTVAIPKAIARAMRKAITPPEGKSLRIPQRNAPLVRLLWK